MGRYYSGDIEGKFWFAVQGSTNADRFGRPYYEPSYVEYYYDNEALPDIKRGIQKILDNLGDYKEAFDEFFEKNNGYNDQMLNDFFKEKKMNTSDLKYLLEEYADLELGRKIEKCVEEYYECSFQAEL
mgnify:CR=1 FL=1|tara:strand:- start:1471 stop:1854 length:384 start_codon:yes stop_codon:yes gene_type:complete